MGQLTNARDVVLDIIKPSSFTGGIEFSSLTYTVTKKQEVGGKWTSQEVDLLHRITGYAPKGSITAVMGPSGAGKSTFLDGLAGRIASGSLKGRVSLDGSEVSPSLIKRTSAYIMQEDRLFPMLTVYETLTYAADFRLGTIPSSEKKNIVEKLIEQLGLTSAKNTYIGDEGIRGISGGERRRVSIGVDIIHGPPLLFLDEPTSGLDSTSAHSVIEKVHHIARSGSTVILTIHQPSFRIQMLLDHLIILARGQLMYQGSPKDVTHYLGRMGRKLPKGENAIEHLLDVIQKYDLSEMGVDPLSKFCLTGLRPPPLSDDMSLSTIPPTPPPAASNRVSAEVGRSGNRAPNDFDHSVRSTWSSRSWSANQSGVMETLRFTPSWNRRDRTSTHNPLSSPGYYTDPSEILPGTPTPHSSDYTVNEDDYLTPAEISKTDNIRRHLGPKFANSSLSEICILVRRNFTNIRRTPELFLSRLVVLSFMGFILATIFLKPKDDLQGITNRLSFFIFTVCVFFFSSNDAVPAFIQERFIFIRETSHNAYRASSYAISGMLTYLPFLAIQALPYSVIVWYALELRGSFIYFFIVLYASLLSTNSFVVFVSSVVPNYIMGFAAVIAFTALFFLFCGFFLNPHDIPHAWKWMNVISTMKYPYQGILMNQFQNNHTFGVDPNGNVVTGEIILKQLSVNLQKFKKWEMVFWMLGWAVLYRFLFYLVLRFASKNQRT
ncbi:ABC transporter G family member STR2-like [Aristolochia californica]|uniref:ABC transporter G family member STR2-like n=1 Tax=Aristolochia californica TaxID=171875 RepID=UPI0035DA8F57